MVSTIAELTAKPFSIEAWFPISRKIFVVEPLPSEVERDFS